MSELILPGEDGWVDIELPHEWEPRPHQMGLWNYMAGGGKRAVVVWHRRAGKDSTAVNVTAASMMARVGTYWHMLPEAKQGRKVIWDAIDKQGRRVIDQAFPHELRTGERNDEMQLQLVNGSIWQVVGSDNYNSLVGANPVGVVMSEYSIANPAAWDFIRPILAENGGWVIFIFTPRGKNHAYKLFQMAENNPEWFAELLTVEDTMIIPPELIERERAEGMDEDLLAQEYFCSWEGSQQGAIFGEQLRRARGEGRVRSVPYVRSAAVNTFWDIGHGDNAVVLCHQHIEGRHRWINAHGKPGEDLSYFVRWLRDTGYLLGRHFLPHDAKNVTMAAKSNPLGSNIYEQLVNLGISPSDIEVVPRTPDKWAAVSAARLKFDTCEFDSEKAEPLLNGLAAYRKEWDEKRQCFSERPYHDWASDWADAFLQWAQGWREPTKDASFTAPRFTPPMPGAKRPPGQSRVGY